MSKGYVPYMTLWDETEVVHTCSENVDEVIVYFEKPDENGFKKLKMFLHNLEIIERKGFNELEERALITFCLNNYDLIAEYSKVGGVYYA